MLAKRPHAYEIDPVTRPVTMARVAASREVAQATAGLRPRSDDGAPFPLREVAMGAGLLAICYWLKRPVDVKPSRKLQEEPPGEHRPAGYASGSISGSGSASGSGSISGSGSVLDRPFVPLMPTQILNGAGGGPVRFKYAKEYAAMRAKPPATMADAESESEEVEDEEVG